MNTLKGEMLLLFNRAFKMNNICTVQVQYCTVRIKKWSAFKANTRVLMLDSDHSFLFITIHLSKN